MKLIKCYVSSFGKLKDFTYDFNDKLNTIKQDNGWGKSTFATFIKAMFYGLNGSKRSVAENERIKYKPWNSTERFGGYVIFSWKGKEYKLERFFGNKESEDTAYLYDAATGKVLSNDKDWGKRIFQIDEEGFLSTTYFSQKDFSAKSNASLTEKYNQISGIDGSLAVDKVIQKIDDKLKKYEYSGNRGLIPETKKEIYRIDEEIKRAESSLETLKLINSEIELLSQEVKSLELRAAKLYAEIENANRAEATTLKKEQYNRLMIEKSTLIEKQNYALEILNENIVDIKTVNKLLFYNQELLGIDAYIENIERDIKTLSNIAPQKKKNNFGSSAVSFIVTLMLLLGGIFTSSISVLPYILYAMSGIMFAISLVITWRNVKNQRKTSSDANTLLLEEKIKQLNNLIEKKNAYKNEIDAYICAFKLGQVSDRATALMNILRVWEISLEVAEKLREVNRDLSAFDFDNTENLNQDISYDINVLKAEYDRVNIAVKQKIEELNKKKASVAWYEDIAGKFADFESEKIKLCDKILEHEEERRILSLTSKFLKQADENLKLKYKTPLQDSLNKYFEYINGQEKTVYIDVDFNVTVEEKGQEIVIDYYSKGYQNLFEICKRFALVDVLFTGEKPFIILDDPFYNLDDQKLSSAISLIKKMSVEYQILYLVCHDSRRANELQIEF